MREARIEFAGVRSIRGSLLVVEDVREVGWDETVEVRLESGEVRHGAVLEVDRDLAVVEVFEGTADMALGGARVSFGGEPMSVPATDAWLGRVLDGRGEPLDGGPPVAAEQRMGIAGTPINPAVRERPSEPILTGISAIDGLTTIVRGQKLPVFSVGGLPHLDLAAQIAAQANVRGEPFAVVFAAMGITHGEIAAVRRTLESRGSVEDTVLFVNTADDPVIERLITPRIALSVAEHLAFENGRHVLVVLADLTNYCEALRQVSSARAEIPSRRGYPGYLYSDLASLLERAGRIAGTEGSVTQLPVLTMPAGDITHPVPDVTGYITEGQVVLSQELHQRGVYPPFDALASLSRLMRRGAGPGHTREDHLAIAAQMYALVARAHRVSDLAEVVGEDALSGADRAVLPLLEAFESRFLDQAADEARSLEETLGRAWEVASVLPAREITMVDRELVARYHRVGDRGAGDHEAPDRGAARESGGGDAVPAR